MSKLILSLFTLLLLLLSLNRTVDPYDESIPLVAAQRIMAGELPYRDFWTLYSPGVYFTLSGVFSVFGQSILVARLVDAFWKVTVVFAILAWGTRLRAGGWAYTGSIVAALWLSYIGLCNSGVWPALSLVLWSLLLLHQGKPYLAGLFGAVAIVYRHDFILPILLGMIPTLFSFRKVARQFLAVWVGCTALFFIVLGATLGFKDVWECLVNGPLQIYPSVWSGLHINFSLILLPLSSLIIGAISFLKNDATDLLKERATLYGIASGILLRALFRFDFAHVLPILFSLLPILAFLVHETLGKRDWRSIGTMGSIIGFSIPLWGIPVGVLLQSSMIQRGQRPGYVSIVGGRVDESLFQVVRYLEKHSSPGERIFSTPLGTIGYERVNLLPYFLSGRPPATYYHELHPGLLRQKETVQKILLGLQRENVRFVLLSDPFGESRGEGELESEIKKRGVKRFSAGKYEIWEKSR
jgi:MFS family permease